MLYICYTDLGHTSVFISLHCCYNRKTALKKQFLLRHGAFLGHYVFSSGVFSCPACALIVVDFRKKIKR